MICNPTGNPSSVNPNGNDKAGRPVTVMKYQDIIQSI